MIRIILSAAAGLCLMTALTVVMVAVLRVALWRQLRAEDRRRVRVSALEAQAA